MITKNFALALYLSLGLAQLASRNRANLRQNHILLAINVKHQLTAAGLSVLMISNWKFKGLVCTHLQAKAWKSMYCDRRAPTTYTSRTNRLLWEGLERKSSRPLGQLLDISFHPSSHPPSHTSPHTSPHSYSLLLLSSLQSLSHFSRKTFFSRLHSRYPHPHMHSSASHEH